MYAYLVRDAADKNFRLIFDALIRRGKNPLYDTFSDRSIDDEWELATKYRMGANESLHGTRIKPIVTTATTDRSRFRRKCAWFAFPLVFLVALADWLALSDGM